MFVRGILFVLLFVCIIPLNSWCQIRQKAVPLGLTEAFLETYSNQDIPTVSYSLYNYSKFQQLQNLSLIHI